MIKLIKLEWSKFSKSTIVVLLFVFFIIFFPSVLYIGKMMPDLPSILPGNEIFFTFPTVWEYLGYAGNWTVFFFLGVLVIYTLTIEIRNKTMRQSIISGMTRNEFFLSKYLNVFLLSLFATVYYTAISLIIGFLNTDGATFGSAFQNDWAIPIFFLMCFSYLSFALFLAFMFRKSGIAIFFYLTYVMVIELSIRWLIYYYVAESYLIQFFPMNATEDLMPLPIFKYADYVSNQEVDIPILLDTNEAVIATSVYCVIFAGISYFNFLKRDI